MNFIHIRVPEETRRQLKVYAASNGISMQTLMNDVIKEFMVKKIRVANP